MVCIDRNNVVMLSGYCLSRCRCDSCGRISELAMCVTKEQYDLIKQQVEDTTYGYYSVSSKDHGRP